MNRKIVRLEEGQGRPRKTEILMSEEMRDLISNKTSVTRLEELGFDPIEGLVLNLRVIENSIERELAKERINDKILTALFSTRARMLETLMPYAYSRAEKLQEKEDSNNKEPLRIILEHGKTDDSD